ncbi:hypothetical protein [Bradyrhizobium sp. 2TAF24]|uniref:hypothetical protein n=1 Tax=Bradyrhizobium sp. 2TAF24 TaxID=3233011 RepID=UPI003F938BE8
MSLAKKLLPLILAATCLSPAMARANDGEIAAGVAGGLIGGMLLGGALAQRPPYAPAPVYVEPPEEEVYQRRCYWTYGAPYWDDEEEEWRRPRRRVCD